MDSNKRRRLGTKVNSKKHRGLEHLEARYVLDSTVVFNEIMYNPAQAEDAGLEWVEFYNQLVVDIDISDWVLEGGIDYTFPDKTRVPGRGHIVLASDPEAFEAATGIPALGPWTGRLSNGGEELRLYNNDQRLMNSVDYRDGGDWPAGPDGSGVTLAKRNQFDASEKSASWTFSPELGGTPGRDNFLDPNKLIIDTILPEEAPVSVFLPSNDSLGTTWTAAGFDDASWTTGTTGVGYDTRSDYVPYFGLNLDEPENGQDPVAMKDVNSSLYMRIPLYRRRHERSRNDFAPYAL
ncbi:MAG: lamin tail domain-containing protein [Pirellulaceae bacterium]